MTAEFFGLPGSGKTTLVSALSAEGGAFQKNREGKTIPLSGHIRNALTGEFLLFSLRCFRVVASKKQKWKPDWNTLRSILKVYLIYMWERAHGGAEYHCYDHGIVQSFAALIWTEYDLKPRALELTELFCRNMQSSLRLVLLQSRDYEEIYQRMLLRGERRRILTLLNKEQAIELMAFQEEFFRDVQAIAEKYQMCVRINAMEPVEVSASFIREQLLT